MKYIFILLTLAALSCKKEDRACYRCIQPYTASSGGGSTIQVRDTTEYCDKTPEEIKQIEDVALLGTVAGRSYLKKVCTKK